MNSSKRFGLILCAFLPIFLISCAADAARIVSPVSGSSFAVGASIPVRISASAPDGLESARLWVNGEFYALDNQAPYEFSVSGLAAGTHTLMVRVKDNKGKTQDSPTISIKVASGSTDGGGTSGGNTGGGNTGGGNTGGGTTGGSTGGGGSGGIVLPIEVLGPAGTKKSISFTLNDSAGITHLYLRCNACGYHNIALDKNNARTKATVRVNGGAAIALKHFIEGSTVYGNRQIKILGGEALYGGIGGGFRTVRMTVPIGGLRSGSNTLEFEHVNADLQSIGFRIIDLNLLRGDNPANRVLSASQLVNDDPTRWTPPRNTSADISTGRSLWSRRDSLYDGWVDSLDGTAGGGSVTGRVRASCADCHAANGRDLKYFNYSNTSIVERSVFHRLTRIQGEQIASYIRSLDMDVVPQARPWHPAYQPGPGLDARPAYQWAAGAGVDAILNNDLDLAPILFPGGTSQSAVDRVVDRYATLNMRQLRVNIPMPEWSQWLPFIHPNDAFRNDFYTTFYTRAVSSPTQQTLGGLSQGIKSAVREGVTCLVNGPGNGEPWRGLNGNAFGNLRLPSTTVTSSNCNSVPRDQLRNIEHAKRGLSAWASVKMWEIVHGNRLEEASRGVSQSVCSSGRCINASEPRGWVADGRNVFDRPPHFTGVAGNRNYFSQNEMLGIFESNTWYHLQLLLNNGYRRTMPAHFAYTYSHVELLQEKSGVDQGYRFWATMIKQRQLQTNGRYGVEEGLDLRTAQPYAYYGTGRGTTNTDTQSSVGPTLWARLAQAMVEDFVDDANNATAEDWARANQNSEVQSRDSTDFSACSGTCTFDLGAFQGKNTYRVIPELRKIGVGADTITRLINWGKKTWPRGPWDRLN